MKKLYRLECHPGHGVYSSRNNDAAIGQKLLQCQEMMENYFEGNLGGEKHPAPYDDTKLYNTLKAHDVKYYQVFYGFSSIDQFRSWFYSDELLHDFDKIGVTLACYNVNNRYDGNAQAVAPLKKLHQENVEWRITLKEFLEKGISNLTPPTTHGI